MKRVNHDISNCCILFTSSVTGACCQLSEDDCVVKYQTVACVRRCSFHLWYREDTADKDGTWSLTFSAAPPTLSLTEFHFLPKNHCVLWRKCCNQSLLLAASRSGSTHYPLFRRTFLEWHVISRETREAAYPLKSRFCLTFNCRMCYYKSRRYYFNRLIFTPLTFTPAVFMKLISWKKNNISS